MKASRLRGIAVVSIAEATKEGTVRDLVLDPNRRRVVALSIRPTGGGADKVVSVKNIHSIGRDAVTITDAEVLRGEHPVRGDGEIYLTKLKGTKALTDKGEIIGTVAEVEVDPDNFSIIGYQLSTGFMSELTGNRKSLPADERVRYGRDALMVQETGPTVRGKESRAESRAEEKTHSPHH